MSGIHYLFFPWTERARRICIHALAWTVFIVYELIFLYFEVHKLESPSVYVCYYSMNISFFYANVALLEYCFNNGPVSYIRSAVLFIGILLAYFVVKLIIGYYLLHDHLSLVTYFGIFSRFIISTTFRLAYFTVLSTFYWATTHISNFRRKAAEAEKQELMALKDKAEIEMRLATAQNAYLRHQLNPHLLFNSLNFVYNSVYQNSPDAACCVVLLSEIMRFSLSQNGTDDKVSLSDEADQIRRLIGINRYRFEKPLAISTVFTGPFDEFRIIPLILFTLVENVFKHGNLIDPKNPATILLDVDRDGGLTYNCCNLKAAKPDHTHNLGIGLNNVRLRLDFAYPGNYTLVISEDEDFYQTRLSIKL